MPFPFPALLTALLHSWGGMRRSKARLTGARHELPSWKALMWLTPLSPLSSPLQLARWQVHVEKRDNQLPTPLFYLCPVFIVPVSLSHPVPRHFLSITLNLLAFLPLYHFPIYTLSGFSLSPHNIFFSLSQSLCTHCSMSTVRLKKREGIIQTVWLLPALHSDTQCRITAEHNFTTGGRKPGWSQNKCWTTLCGIILRTALSNYVGQRGTFLSGCTCQTLESNVSKKSIGILSYLKHWCHCRF